LDPADGLDEQTLKTADIVFPVLHGIGGEDGTLQAQLDKLGLPYVGTGAEASSLCFDKWRYKEVLDANAIPNPPGTLVTEAEFWQAPLRHKPYVLKPNDGGSSVDTVVKRGDKPEADEANLHDIFQRRKRMLLEALIEGQEITVAVLGNQSLPVIEIIPPPSGEFDYENKYNGQSQELCPPQHISPDVQSRAQELALQVHGMTGCLDFSRTDFMVDAEGNLFVLETNTIPGMTVQSLFPKAAAAAGYDMPTLCDELIKMAFARFS
jgi:D-alanine-D-alanine ligase